MPNLTVMLWHNADDGIPSAWTLLPSFSGLRWLYLCSKEGVTCLLPSPFTLRRNNPFVTLKTAVIEGMERREWSNLVEILNDADSKTESGLPLTRLKLGFTNRITNDELRNVLSALRRSAIQFLTINSVTATPDLIDNIAHTFPNLQSLALTHDSDQGPHRFPSWPFPTWDYAQRLAQFNCLKHFGWNNASSPTWSPSAMVLLEAEFPDDWPDYEDDSSPSETKTNTVRLFASYCSSMCTMSFYNGMYPLYNYSIGRSASGRIAVTEVPDSSPEIQAFYCYGSVRPCSSGWGPGWGPI